MPGRFHVTDSGLRVLTPNIDLAPELRRTTWVSCSPLVYSEVNASGP